LFVFTYCCEFASRENDLNIVIASFYACRKGASSSFIHSFIHFHIAFPLENVAWTATSGEFEIPLGQKQFQMVLLASHQDESNLGRRCNHSTWSFVRPLDRFFTGVQQDVPQLFFLGYSLQIVEQSQLRSPHSDNKGFNIQGYVNFTNAHFVVKLQTVNSLEKICISTARPSDNTLIAMRKIYDHR